MDPIGFGLENFDVLGRWRTEDAGGKPIDNRGELPDGTVFEGPEQLKEVLFKQKHLLIRNLTAKLLGYALGRGLTLEEQCTVDQIVQDVEKNDYSAHTLLTGVVRSIPFRYQAGTVPNTPVTQLPVSGNNGDAGPGSGNNNEEKRP